jgi:hypothetical protein
MCIAMETDWIRMESDPNIIFYHILIQINMGVFEYEYKMDVSNGFLFN